MRPKILITNDDGIHSVGLKQLWRSLADHAAISIIAPASDQSGSGLGVTLRTPLQVEPVEWEKQTPAWKVTGTPADCVKLGLAVILKEKPQLILSGINRGSNSGRTLLYSGTVGGVIEGAFRYVPGIAFSHESEMENTDFAQLRKYIHPLVKYVLENPLPRGTILNVNIPEVSEFKGIKLARQGKSYWMDNPDARIHPEGNRYFWLGGRWDDHQEEKDSDVSLLKEGYITVVPIHIDELTDHSLLQQRRPAFDRLFDSFSFKSIESK